MIVCQEITELKEEYVSDLEQELTKSNKTAEGSEIISMIIIDIKAYLNQQNSQFLTTQQIMVSN